MKTNTTDKAMARPLGIFGDYNYLAITPQADTDKLCAATARIMFWHLRGNERGVEVFFAKQGELRAGWVIGIVDPSALPLTNQSEHAALVAVAESANCVSYSHNSTKSHSGNAVCDQKFFTEMNDALANLASVRNAGESKQSPATSESCR